MWAEISCDAAFDVEDAGDDPDGNVDDPDDDAVPSDDAGNDRDTPNGMRVVDDVEDNDVPSDDAGNDGDGMRAVDDREENAAPRDDEEDDILPAVYASPIPPASPVIRRSELFSCSHVEVSYQNNQFVNSLLCYKDRKCSTLA